MPLANFPNGFRGGVQIQGMPQIGVYSTSAGVLNPRTAGVWFVDSATGLDGNKGDSWYQPLATIQGAFTKAAAYDIILVKAGHAETISTATAAAWNVAGVQIVGLGIGSAVPQITLDTLTTSTITVSAANISVTNCQFVANFANIATLFTLTTAKGFTMNSCVVRDTSSILNFLIVVTTSATSNANDGLLLTNNNVFLAATSGVVNFVKFVGTHDRCQISGNYFSSATTNAAAVFPISTTKVLTNFQLLSNDFNLVNAIGTGTGYLITTDGSTNSGIIAGNYDHSLPSTPLLCTASSGFIYNGNLHSDVADLQGYLVPAADV